MRFWTLATVATLPHARVLAGALRREHPGARLVIVHASPSPPPGDELYEARPLRDVAPEVIDLLDRFPWEGVSLIARAAVLRAALRDGDDAVALVDPETDLHAPLAPVEAALRDHAVALVPRADGDLPDDGDRPSSADLRRAGIQGHSLIAARPGPEADRVLAWWAEHVEQALGTMPLSELVRLRRRPSARLAQWLDLAAPTFPSVVTVGDPGTGVSAWNLHERSVEHDGDGRWLVDGVPLRLADFAGFAPTTPYWLAPGADRVRVVERPALLRLCERYAAALLEAGWAPVAAVEPGATLPNGLLFDRRLADLYEIASLQGAELGDIRTADGAARFEAWLAGPARRGARHGVNRYTERVWGERADVVRVFGDLDGDDGAGYARWLWEWGRDEMAIPERFLPPAPAGVVAASAEEEQAAVPPVHVIGFMKGTLGLGAAARLYVEALTAAGLEVSTQTVAPPAPEDELDEGIKASYAEVDFADRARRDESGAIDIVCVNADELPIVARRMGSAFGRGRRTIGVWAWETDHIPDRWMHAYPLVDEVWTYTRFVAESIARVSPVPVVPIPIPVPTPDPSSGDAGFDLPDGFRFLFVFDFLSTPARKNPAGLVKAFTSAFAPGEGPQLIIKTLHGDLRPKWLDHLRWLAGGRDDIHLVDRSLSLPQRDALMGACDCYVSLHRAEGFGLTIAEAMALGKPTIATGYSGNLDFQTARNSFLVEYEPALVGPEGEHYPAEGVWADPDLEHAAQLMRRVLEHPGEARAKGERARRDIAEHLSPEAVGRVIRRRLAGLEASGRPPAGR